MLPSVTKASHINQALSQGNITKKLIIMELDLSPNSSPCKLFEGEGGSYHFWSPSDLPLLRDSKVGAAKFVLKPLGFALLHYSDSTKIGYVLEGRGMAGLVLPQDQKEKIVRLEKGDTIQVPLGGVSWWYNDDETSELTIIFLGDTSGALSPGDFTYFFLAGTIGALSAFSTELVTKSLGVDERQAEQLFGSQPGVLIVRLQERLQGLEPCKGEEEKAMKRAENDLFCAEIVRLDSGEVWGPKYSPEPAVQVVYVLRGSGRLQIVSCGGQRALDAEVKEGELFVVPKFFVASAIAGGQGLEWFSILTSSRNLYGNLGGKGSLLKALSPQILGVSLNVDQEDLVKIMGSKN